jgi:hypothetical protein
MRSFARRIFATKDLYYLTRTDASREQFFDFAVFKRIQFPDFVPAPDLPPLEPHLTPRALLPPILFHSHVALNPACTVFGRIDTPPYYLQMRVDYLTPSGLELYIAIVLVGRSCERIFNITLPEWFPLLADLYQDPVTVPPLLTVDSPFTRTDPSDPASPRLQPTDLSNLTFRQIVYPIANVGYGPPPLHEHLPTNGATHYHLAGLQRLLEFSRELGPQFDALCSAEMSF